MRGLAAGEAAGAAGETVEVEAVVGAVVMTEVAVAGVIAVGATVLPGQTPVLSILRIIRPTTITTLIPILPVPTGEISVRGATAITNGVLMDRTDTAKSVISTVPMARMARTALTSIPIQQIFITSTLQRELLPIPMFLVLLVR